MNSPESALRALLSIFVLVTCLPAANAADVAAGRQIFESNCAVCHGGSGSPDPDSPVVQGLGITPANLSDPLFNSREPTGDWEMVVKYGGAAMGLAAQMPAHEGALTDEQVTDVTAYVKSLVDTSAYPPGEMNLFLPVRTKKAFPEDEVVYKGRYTSLDGDDVWKNVLEIEKRFGKAGQGILEFVHVDDGTTSELTDVEVGWKQALSWSRTHVLSAAAVFVIPIATPVDDGELQTYLAFGTQISPQWILQSSLRFKLPVDDIGDGEAELAGIVHWVHSPWPRRVFPALEIVAEQPFRSRNGDLQWTALPQVRIGLTRGGHVAMNLGLELPLSGQVWDHSVHLTLLWDFADGSLFKGW
ncbi:MAG: cytochrome c [Gammaproteobacteria bacterium]|nr:cytochrome c [Gammaproteobacteria bacterium]